MTPLLFPQAVEAIDRGDLAALQALLDAHPALVRERFENGEQGYFARPYLLAAQRLRS